VYLTKTGLSCESGDDGEVGRGNRINGLITPFRSMSLEAAAGKNPVNHVGKIYNVLSEEITREVATLHQNQVKDCTVLTVSQIGRSIADPKNLNIKITMKKGEKLETIQKQVQNLAEEKLENITKLTQEIIQGKHQMF
jgi:S-adenosylmethionine synthetase